MNSCNHRKELIFLTTFYYFNKFKQSFINQLLLLPITCLDYLQASSAL